MSDKPLPQRRRRTRRRPVLRGTSGATSEHFAPDVTSVSSIIHTYDHIVIGGGIAGVACVRQLVSLQSSSLPPSICLVTASPSVKDTTNVVRLTETLESFDVVERPLLEFLREAGDGVAVLRENVVSLDRECKILTLGSGQKIRYSLNVCIATGARPNIIADHPRVLGVRDVDSAQNLAERLRHCGRVAIIGNGAIAMEALAAILSGLPSLQVLWVSKERYMGSSFLDATASDFLERSWPELQRAIGSDGAAFLPESWSETFPGKGIHKWLNLTGDDVSIKGCKLTVPSTDQSDLVAQGPCLGNALGPRWAEDLKRQVSPGLCGICAQPTKIEVGCCGVRTHTVSSTTGLALGTCGGTSRLVREFGTSVQDISSPSSSEFFLRLTNGKVYSCGLVISATGVIPNVEFLGEEFNKFIDHNANGGLKVSLQKEKPSLLVCPSVYVAGDAADIQWNTQDKCAQSEFPCWFQMRLWSQARTQGRYAALEMHKESQRRIISSQNSVDDDLLGGMAFELFAHATEFFGQPCVFLGRFNGQGLGEEYESAVKRTVVLVKSGEKKDLGSSTSVTTLSRAIDSGVHGLTVQPCSEDRLGSSTDFEIIVRVTPEQEYIKVVLYRSCVVGAMIVGDTELAETFENLILNKLPVGHLDLLSPDIDLDDYFD